MPAPTYHLDPHTLREIADNQDEASEYADTLLARYRALALHPAKQQDLASDLVQWLRITGQFSRAEEVARTSVSRSGGAELLENLASPAAPVEVPLRLILPIVRLATALACNADNDPTKVSQAADLFDACESALVEDMLAARIASPENMLRLSVVLHNRAKLRLSVGDRILALRDANLALTLRLKCTAPSELVASSQFCVDAILVLIETDIEQQVNAAGASIATETFAAGDRSGFGAVSGDKRVGPWLFWFKDGRIKSAGHYLNDQLTGPWVWFREHGWLLQEGSFANNLQEGMWVRYYANGNILDRGHFTAGKKTGHWEYFNEDGSPKHVARRERYLLRKLIGR